MPPVATFQYEPQNLKDAGVRLWQGGPDGVIIFHLSLDVLECLSGAGTQFRLLDTFVGEFDVFSGHLGAIVEVDPYPQLEFALLRAFFLSRNHLPSNLNKCYQTRQAAQKPRAMPG